MTVYDLNRDQLIELKQQYLTNFSGEEPSYKELADADEIITDEQIRRYCRDMTFTPDDFFCSAGQEEDDTCRLVIEDANRHDIAYDLQYIADQIEGGYTNGILSDGATWYIE